MGRSSSVVVALVVVVVVCAAASGTVDAALRVFNGIEAEVITVKEPPGCCNYCTGEVCPAVCETCKDVVIESRTEVTLEPNVGPYPLESLRVQAQGTDIYCVPADDLKYLTATARLRVGPGDCGAASPTGIRSVVADGSDRFDTCLRLCDQGQDEDL